MKLAFTAAQSERAHAALTALEKRYGAAAVSEADVIVALGGDGFMLHTLHGLMADNLQTPIYGMNLGATGFLMNQWREEDLLERIASAQKTSLHPLSMLAHTPEGEQKALAINEVSLLRSSAQSAHIRIDVDGRERLNHLVSDGVLIATPAGSTAYNVSVNGPILPLGAPLLALTPISVHRPRRWRGALLPHSAKITFEVLDANKRPVNAYADHYRVLNALRVEIHEDANTRLNLLFDENHSLEERILSEQFITG